eukprot:CAMPEP_0182921238 /NCGR_PEP_ID=MMETSP0105_2-20130417/4021_1 /TAXON_ID=81532 ORGANISM="Acanthoeca-like sp., Strain 10tr" /NCGR_SAMPLE_ID=MMETSP0105_2 /ASSEMBLY_ACC=CAM_ASM_000205 /LENGTH=41 /DNA_ID= /DNA_START= /DNA_END= /DNA_ORIENTATION=
MFRTVQYSGQSRCIAVRQLWARREAPPDAPVVTGVNFVKNL